MVVWLHLKSTAASGVDVTLGSKPAGAEPDMSQGYAGAGPCSLLACHVMGLHFSQCHC